MGAGPEQDAAPVVADSRSEELTDGQETPSLPPSLPLLPAHLLGCPTKVCGQLAGAAHQLAPLQSAHMGLQKVLNIATDDNSAVVVTEGWLNEGASQRGSILMPPHPPALTRKSVPRLFLFFWTFQKQVYFWLQPIG